MLRMATITIVTALYDINRSSHGDGRTIDEYFNWLEKTLSLKNANFVIFIQDTLYERFIRRLTPTLTFKITTIEDIPYYKYKSEMDTILQSDEYKKLIRDPSRIECKLAMYNIIQYSKLEWIRKVIEENPYNSSHFFWMDAGCSRFFCEDNTTVPNNSLINNKITIQGRHDLYIYPNWNLLYIDSANLLCGTLFGGGKENMLWLADMIRDIFEQLLKIKVVNNEQIALAMLWKLYPDKFNVYINNTNTHLPLFKALSLSFKE
jgi:hypothetical protein